MNDHLVGVPVEAYPYMTDICFDGRHIVGSLILPFSTVQKRLLGSARRLSSHKKRLDNFLKFDSNELCGSKKFGTFGELIRYADKQRIFMTDNMNDYISIAIYGVPKKFEPPNRGKARNDESIREWVSSVKNKGQFYSSWSNDCLTLYEGIFQTVRGFTVAAFKEVPPRIVRFVNNKIPKLLVSGGYRTLSYVKEFADYCGSKFFEKDVTMPTSNPFSVYVPYLDYKRFAWGRYITRSLPHGPPPDLQTYVDRVSTPGEFNINVLESFKTYVVEWARQFAPSQPQNPSFKPTCNSSIERLRSDGGQSSIYNRYIKYQICRLKSLDRKVWTEADKFCNSSLPVRRIIKGAMLSCFESGTCYPNFCMRHSWSMETSAPKISGDWAIAHARFILLVAACWNCVKLFPTNPIQILVLKERGGKYRIPTKSLLPVQVLGNLMRSRLNDYMERDSTMRASLTDADFKVFKPQPGKFIRSQDLSYATDMYSYEVVRTMHYSLLEAEVYKGLPFAKEYIDWVYPKDGRDIVIPSTLPISWSMEDTYILPKPSPYWRKIYDSKPLYRKFLGNFCQDNFPVENQILNFYASTHDKKEMDIIKAFVVKFENSYTEFVKDNFKVVGTQRRGPCMGEPLSWPLLPIVTKFAYESSHSFERNLQTCGDDGAFITTELQNQAYNGLVEGLGGCFNWSKDFTHPSRYILVERLYDGGELVGVMPIAPAFSLPTQKQEQTYITVGSSLKALAKIHQVDNKTVQRLLRHCRFRKEIDLYNKLVVPAKLPCNLGGLDVDLPEHKFNYSVYRKIKSFVLSYSREDLIKNVHLSWSRMVKQPIRINQDMVKHLLNGTGPKSCWRLGAAWEVKSQSIYGLASLTGSAPIEMDVKRPLIYGRQRYVRSILDGYEDTRNNVISITTLSNELQNRQDPVLRGFEPTLGDDFPLKVVCDYKGLEFNQVYTIIIPSSGERRSRRLAADSAAVSALDL